MAVDPEFRPLVDSGDFEAALRLACRVFPTLYPYDSRRNGLSVARRTENHMGTDRSLSTVGMVDRRAVSTVFVIPYAMRVGRSMVRVAGVRAVGVEPGLRGRGLCTRTLNHTLAKAEAAGYPVSFLFGIPDFYHRFGYSAALAELRIRLETAHLSDRVDGWRVRRFGNADHAWAGRLYNRFTHHRSGSRVRADRPLRPVSRAQVLESGDGRQRGYVFWQVREIRAGGGSVRPALRTEIQVPEHGYVGGGFVDAMLAFLTKQANRIGADRILLHLYRDHPSLESLCRGRVVVEEHFDQTGGPMVAVLDPLAALRAVREELAARLKGGSVRIPKRGIVIGADRGRVRISMAAGEVCVDPADGEPADLHAGRHLGRLLLGHGHPEQTLRQHKLRCRPEARLVIQTLFPEQAPYISPMDAY